MGLEFKKKSNINNTGIPDKMKKNVEAASGLSFDDVRIHYNSPKPKNLNSFAYTKGNDVYIAKGQEKYLSHELGHVVQQKKGLVPATTTRNGVKINDNPRLEREADNFGTNLSM